MHTNVRDLSITKEILFQAKQSYVFRKGTEVKDNAISVFINALYKASATNGKILGFKYYNYYCRQSYRIISEDELDVLRTKIFTGILVNKSIKQLSYNNIYKIKEINHNRIKYKRTM